MDDDKVVVKPTWGLTWGLFWRQLLITLGLIAVLSGIVAAVGISITSLMTI